MFSESEGDRISYPGLIARNRAGRCPGIPARSGVSRLYDGASMGVPLWERQAVSTSSGPRHKAHIRCC
jgi:hypothetical protein